MISAAIAANGTYRLLPIILLIGTNPLALTARSVWRSVIKSARTGKTTGSAPWNDDDIYSESSIETLLAKIVDASISLREAGNESALVKTDGFFTPDTNQALVRLDPSNRSIVFSATLGALNAKLHVHEQRQAPFTGRA
jgi:hypothetical protein